ncbi:MAG: S-layer homology domain-containing protein [Clostridia bacterium]|nr:S-layer homology domain-containing protein [Clostridia bacterium]
MRKCFKLLAFVMACFFLMSGTVSMAMTFSDVSDGTQYKDSITTLTTIGLIKGYEDGSFRPDNTITRAEFTTIVVRALGVEDIQADGENFIFSDIDSHYAKYNIKTAYALGIINGFDDGTFKPDNTVTYEQAVKMVVCMLGYGSNAEASGGYPTGYISVAGQLGLTRDITTANSSPASRAVIAKLIDNSLTVNIQQTIVSVDGSYKYKVTDDTILETKLGITKSKVLVTGVEKTFISTEETLQSGQMQVMSLSDGTIKILDFSNVYKNSSDVSKILGYVINIYYKDVEDNEIDTLIAVDDQTQKNNVIEVTSRNIEELSGGYLKYTNTSGKYEKIRLKCDNVSVIYNGKLVSKTKSFEVGSSTVTLQDALDMWLNVESDNFINGDIKIIDSSADGEADVLFINNYSVMVASSAPTSTDYIITDKLVSGNSLTLDPDDDSYSYTIIKNGSTIETTSIAANDVLLYAISLDGELITVYDTASPVTGEITEIDDDKITVGGSIYYISQSCVDYMDDDIDDIKVGATGTFYIDKYNNVIFCSITQSASASYGYIISTYSDETSDTYGATVYLPSSATTQKIAFKDKVSISGSNISKDDVADKLEDTASLSRADINNADTVYKDSANKASANSIAQLVKVGISNNLITKIITLSDTEGVVNKDSDKLVRYKTLAKYKYSATNNFSDQFYINSSTVILYVPANRSSKSDYQKFTASTLFKTNQSYWLEAYDVNDSKIASLVVVYGNSSLADITKDTVMSVVAKAPSETTVSDDTVTKLTLYMSTISLVTKNAEDNEEFADVEPGDVIQFGYNNNSQIINRKDIISADSVKEVLNASNTLYDWTDDAFDVPFMEDGAVVIDSTTNTTYSRAFVANVLEVTSDDSASYIRVTQDGFNTDGTISDTNAERYEVTSSTPIIRFNTSTDTLSAYVGNTSTKLSISNIKDAKYNSTSCSKLMIYTLCGEVKFIMIYEQ